MAIRPARPNSLHLTNTRMSSPPPASQMSEAMELEFIFDPSDSGPGPRHKSRAYINRAGTALAFWRHVKDALRRMATGHDKRGSYLAPGPHGRHNNIEPAIRPGHTHSHYPHQNQTGQQPDSEQLAIRQTQVAVPSLPDYHLPEIQGRKPVGSIGLSRSSIPHPPINLRGGVITENHPVSFKQEVLFVSNEDIFIDKRTAMRAVSDLIEILKQNSDLEVHIQGNAANDEDINRRDDIFYSRLKVPYKRPPRVPYGWDKKKLINYPEKGYYRTNDAYWAALRDGTDPDAGYYMSSLKPNYGETFRTIGDLMLARAKAVGRLLINQGISPNRIHCSIGEFSYGETSVPRSADLKRRATIIVKYKK